MPEATGVGTLYLERLSERDLRLLAGSEGPGAAARLRAEPARICERIASPEVYDALFAPWVEEPFVLASPLLVFSVLLAQTARELAERTHIREWIGPGRRVPVFDVIELVAHALRECRDCGVSFRASDDEGSCPQCRKRGALARAGFLLRRGASVPLSPAALRTEASDH